MLRDVLVQSKSAAAAASAAKAEAEAAKTQAQALAPDIVSLTPLATHLAELDYKVAAGAAGQRKILAGIDALRETQRAELLTLQGEVRDQLVETAKMVGAGHEQMRQRQEAAAAVSEGVANNVKRVLEMLERAEKREAAAAAAKEDAANAEAKPAPEPEPEPDATVMDVNVDDSVAQIAATPPDVHADTRAAIDEMIAEVKAAEPQLAERLGAASAEWMMVQAVKAAEPYLSDGAGSAAAKLLRAVKAAEPFASRRIAAANAMWNIVLTVKEAEPRVERKAIHPAEYEILRAVKAAEPYLVQDLDMGGTASKLLRAVKGAEPRRPRFGAERAAAQMLKTAKWSEPVLRRPPGEASAGAGASPAQTKDAHASTSSLAPSEATPNAPNARARRPSTQPVRNLGVTDSGEWHFTLLAPLERTDARDGLQIQSCEIMLSREAHRSWAGDLFSLWHASHETCWTVGPFTTALLLNPDVDMVVLDGGWWRVSRDGDVYTVRERVAEDA
ncbi:hypothetical protein CC85DRAFT_169621 [Cutaneotrichosporon oleaginosum]|uniref:Uncharacterized protein n=1 Tax=Cutaneotrichosporon oleaginosum TaxID=879819 RepID=A0A0J0XVC2_9TREE|nr:uncharacterized protein CC85DRAFT_169621 [Cutaneotrichosporon oleaginosum]KLT45012.1 hypothetical protein CC85DRAFT_169621 [Cutaneotrichosporon oleaginosum]TXT09700.1 hypothetical protein COLE_03634 [Cutaneotrichosporon oleaginosum]